MTFMFGTKAETLDRLRSLIRVGTLCEQFTFTVADWHQRSKEIVENICRRFAHQSLAIRSSARDEDGILSSRAGAYRSVTRVPSQPDSVADAVRQVIVSYVSEDDGHQILVQPMVENVVISGVVLSHDLDTLSPYYSVNYDDFSGRTDTVTGGVVNKAMLVFRSRPEGLHSPRIRRLINIVQGIERATNRSELDIEFCITSADEVFILQVRPLTVASALKAGEEGRFESTLEGIHEQLDLLMRPADGMLGRTTVFGEMPDWNPAEMIGSAPRPLALSIYKSLITDSIWRISRRRMGYRPVPEVPLLIDFGGRPYIDVRASLNSFLPCGIEEELGRRLIDFQIDLLEQNPQHHDKIEFEIATTCRDFAFTERADVLRHGGFSKQEIDSFELGLAQLTAKAIENHVEHLAVLEETVGRLSRRTSDGSSSLLEARRLLDECREYGTTPFADLARHAFIGISLLRSLVSRGVFTPDESERFSRSIRTVAGDIVRDMQAMSAGNLSMADFLSVYGHLRPGTYDIMSWRYDEKPDLYLGPVEVPTAEHEPFVLTPAMRHAIEKLLAEFGYRTTPEGLLHYIAAAVRLREAAKFHFSRNISDALSLLVQWGESEALSRDDLSYLEIGRILESNEDGRLSEHLERARGRYEQTRAIRLPHLIVAPEDVYVVRLPLGQPNFITRKSVTAVATELRAGEFPNIDGKIVLTECADPGFDWIFLHKIAGLVTKFGGANSHMAIRCAEFGLPAAVGCGERIYKSLAKASVIVLNAGDRIVRAAR